MYSGTPSSPHIFSNRRRSSRFALTPPASAIGRFLPADRSSRISRSAFPHSSSHTAARNTAASAEPLVNDYVVEIGTMLVNFITEFLYQKFVVYRGSIDTNARAKKEKE